MCEIVILLKIPINVTSNLYTFKQRVCQVNKGYVKHVDINECLDGKIYEEPCKTKAPGIVSLFKFSLFHLIQYNLEKAPLSKSASNGGFRRAFTSG